MKREYNKVVQEREKLESQIQKLEKKLKADYGTVGAFLSIF